MKAYLICPVRGVSDQALAARYVSGLEAVGYSVHFPPRDVDQSDPTGAAICAAHLAAMRDADEVHVIWDIESKGSHFDLGMAYALGKKIFPVSCVHEDPADKSYWKAVINPASV